MSSDERDRNRGKAPPRPRRKAVRAALFLAAAVFAAFAAAVALLPWILSSIDWPEVEFDLAAGMAPELRAAFTNGTARVGFRVLRSRSRDLSVRARGVVLDWPLSVDADIAYSIFGLEASGDAEVRIPGSPWRMTAFFSWSAGGGWKVEARLPETAFDAADPVIGALAARLAADAAEIDSLEGRLSFEASASAASLSAPPEWKASARAGGVSAAVRAGDSAAAVENLRFRAGASGIGAHLDIAPLFPRADTVEAAGVTVSNVFASVRATESGWLVTEAGAEVLGGSARAYALFLNPERLNAGFTLYLDDIDAGRVLALARGFNGTASGRLFGKLEMKISEGREVTLGDAYLRSAPGETGTIRMDDPAELVGSLAAAGVDGASRENLSKALKCLRYSAFSADLRRDGGEHSLGFKLEGEAGSGGKTVPVTFDITLRGGIEQLVNMGIRAARAGNSKEGKSR